MPARLAELKRVAPEIEFISAKTADDAAKVCADADAVVGFSSLEIVKNGKSLRWIQIGHAGIEKELKIKELVDSKIVVTNLQRINGPNVADQAFALLLCLTRDLRETVAQQTADLAWKLPKTMGQELHGKTMLVVGLGGIGTQIARRADAFGMRVRAIDPKDMERPSFVFSLDKPSKLMDLIPQADVIVLACPLTKETYQIMGDDQIAAMKKTAYLINIGRGGLVKTTSLVFALEKKNIAGAGLDVSDPEPLPQGHILFKLPNAVVSPHIGGQSPEATERTWKLFRENIRRFSVGETLLCVVDKAKGY
jgi:phosphoglycerate dehydrogenase-like enzyme